MQAVRKRLELLANQEIAMSSPLTDNELATAEHLASRIGEFKLNLPSCGYARRISLAPPLDSVTHDDRCEATGFKAELSLMSWNICLLS